MKNIIALVCFIALSSCGAKQVLDKSVVSQTPIKQKGFQLVLKNVFNDSRCPENVTCVWAGEVTTVISVLENNKPIEEKTLIFNSKNIFDNINWVSKYYTEKPIKSVQVLPHPKDSVKVAAKDYFLKIEY